MLKGIKEGQQVTPTLLKRQPDDSQQKPVKHCGICSCNSHHTDECPQLQEDNAVALTHNFYDATTNLPYNRQYYTQGGRDRKMKKESLRSKKEGIRSILSEPPRLGVQSSSPGLSHPCLGVDINA
ncbi:hypothetical protein PIB30_076562 [Stylosanthes scabra]|uniref:Uncharacterized protein n=1 Tax=Stylosanthes scabra TaxID=79078 RepID=A0ABU6ZPJ8_9FABA|nr:hypothetical protein [Stylosanthes scabra]